MKRTKALLFLTLALCAALLTGCRSNVPNTTDGRVDGTEPSALIPTAASEIMTEPSAATEDSRAESESGMTEASEGTTNAANARSSLYSDPTVWGRRRLMEILLASGEM